MELDFRKNVIHSSEVLDLLKKISKDKKDEFNQLLGIYSDALSDNLDWLVELPASRNPIQSDLFYHFCCLHLVNELIKSDTKIETIIVDSSELSKVLKLMMRKLGVSFKIQIPKAIVPRNINYFLRSFKIILRTWKIKYSQFRAAKKTNHLSTIQDKNELILIDTFIISSIINKDGYYDYLWEALPVKDKMKTFFVPTLVNIKENKFETVYSELRTSDRNFLIKEDYLIFSDLIFSLLHIFRVWFIKLPFNEVLGVNFSPLIKEELISRGGTTNVLEGLLNYRFVKRLKDHSFTLSLVIDWWEGQPIDKGWNLGFNSFFPYTPSKGYMGYAHPINMEMHLCPSESDIRNLVTPRKFSTIGQRFSDEMIAMNSSIEIETAPSFRYNHIWESSIVINKISNNFKILICLSIFADESANILEKVIDSGLLEDNEIDFVLKPHPTMRLDKIKKQLLGKWSNRFYLGQNSTPEEMRASDLLITGMSSVGMEALVLGLPVVIVEKMSGLSFNPIHDYISEDMWRKCSSSEQLYKAINTFKNRSQEQIIEHKKLGNQYKKDYFEPVNKDTIYKFLELKV